jgi:FKBP-type peptidyl-prolyl cis-trans isomerase FklB
LGYGASGSSSITGYTNLVFEVALYDFWHPGETRPAFKSR